MTSEDARDGGDEMRKRTKLVIAGAAVAAVLAIGGGIAIAGAGGDDQPLTGSTKEQASQAALASVGGGTVLETEASEGAAAYEVEVRRTDGSVVDVQLDADFNVLGNEADDDSGGGDEGGGDD
jgi:uncharacterized membrane protein YkoI